MRGLATVRPPRASQHDPEKWTPVFGKDHAQTINQNEIVKRHFVLAFVTRPTRPPIKALFVAVGRLAFSLDSARRRPLFLCDRSLSLLALFPAAADLRSRSGDYRGTCGAVFSLARLARGRARHDRMSRDFSTFLAAFVERWVALHPRSASAAALRAAPRSRRRKA